MDLLEIVYTGSPKDQECMTPRKPQLIAVFWTEYIIDFVFVALRFRAPNMIKSIGIDDWAMSFTQV